MVVKVPIVLCKNETASKVVVFVNGCGHIGHTFQASYDLPNPLSWLVYSWVLDLNFQCFNSLAYQCFKLNDKKVYANGLRFLKTFAKI